MIATKERLKQIKLDHIRRMLSAYFENKHVLQLPNDTYYVYIIWRTNTGRPVPRYVGKGRNNRAWKHFDISRKGNPHLRNAIVKDRAEGYPFLITAVYVGEDEMAAYKAEQLAIAIIGRESNGGPLYNISPGGYKQPLSEEHRKWLSEYRKKQCESEEERERMRGLSELSNRPESIEKQKRSLARYWSQPESRTRHSLILKQRYEDPEYRKKASEATKKVWESPEFRDKIKQRYQAVDSDTVEQIRLLRSDDPQQWSTRKLAERFAISEAAVSKILARTSFTYGENPYFTNARTKPGPERNLTDSQVWEIDRLRKMGKKVWTIQKLADRFGLSARSISDALKRQGAYKDVPGKADPT